MPIKAKKVEVEEKKVKEEEQVEGNPPEQASRHLGFEVGLPRVLRLEKRFFLVKLFRHNPHPHPRKRD